MSHLGTLLHFINKVMQNAAMFEGNQEQDRAQQQVESSAAWAIRSGKHRDYGEISEERRCRGEFMTSLSGRMSVSTPGFRHSAVPSAMDNYIHSI